MNEELINKLKNVVNKLEYAKDEINNAKNILDKSIILDNETFRLNDILNLNQNINTQIYTIENTIIPELEK